LAEFSRTYEREIDKIEDKNAYNMAWRASKDSREYVKSRKFQLMFLRSDNFCIEKDAIRLVAFMEGMLEYYGKDVLGRPLFYDDLDPDSQEYLKSGVYQLMQARDSAGHVILFDYHL
jgi:DNA polymerase III delta prime subunit